MVKPCRMFALVLALVAAFSLAPVPGARAADVAPALDVGAARVAHVFYRKIQPWILVILEELLDCVVGTGGAPPPPPPPSDPPVPDPDYTP